MKGLVLHLNLISQRVNDSQENPPCPSFPRAWKPETQFCGVVVLKWQPCCPQVSFCRWQIQVWWGLTEQGGIATCRHSSCSESCCFSPNTFPKSLFFKFARNKYVAWAHCILWLMFLAQRYWCDLNFCVASEGLTLALFKIRLVTSLVDNWLSTALVSEPSLWFLLPAKVSPNTHSMLPDPSVCQELGAPRR